MHHANLLQQLQQGCYQDVQDVNLACLMTIAIEGPELSTIDFKEILDVFKESCNRRIHYNI